MLVFPLPFYFHNFREAVEKTPLKQWRERLLNLVTEIVEGVMEDHGKEVSAKSSKDVQTLYQSCCDENGEFVF